MSNGDTAVCFAGESLDKLTVKMIRFDSLVSENYYKDLLLVNLQERDEMSTKITEKQDKKIQRLERMKKILLTTNGIMLIFVVCLIIV